MNASQNAAFGHLLAAWRRRDDARHSSDLRELAEARFALDSARTRVRSTIVPPR